MKSIHPLTAGAELVNSVAWPAKKSSSIRNLNLLRRWLAGTGDRIRSWLAAIGLALLLGLIFLGASYIFLSQLARYGW